MKIVSINSVPNGSTGSIMLSIHKSIKNAGIKSYVVWGRGRISSNDCEIYLHDKLGVYFHKIYTLLTDKTGFASIRSTKRLINKLNTIKPDIIHLHNLHGYYINIQLLFKYIKENNVKVIWTFHDCWPFTGHCSHFEYSGCDKWKSKCYNCPKYMEYPRSLNDNSEWNYIKKKELFLNIKRMIIVTPSDWLAGMVKKSFLKDYSIKVINNGIDTCIFKKISSDKLKFRKNYNLGNKKIVLGVAAQFNSKKGFNDFLKLSKVIDDDYVIVLVGLTDKQIKKLPSNIIGIKRTSNTGELVDIYNSSNIFVNLTYEDNYPTVNLEAIACGTPVLTYDTGGSVEFIKFLSSNNKKYIVEKQRVIDDICVLKQRIKEIVADNDFKFENSKIIDKEKMVNEYIKLYKY